MKFVYERFIQELNKYKFYYDSIYTIIMSFFRGRTFYLSAYTYPVSPKFVGYTSRFRTVAMFVIVDS
jgi:hypothetical protein